MDRSNKAASFVSTDNKIGSNLTATGLAQDSHGKQRGTPQDGLNLLFSCKIILEYCSGDPDFLNQQDLDLLSKTSGHKQEKIIVLGGTGSIDSARNLR